MMSSLLWPILESTARKYEEEHLVEITDSTISVSARPPCKEGRLLLRREEPSVEPVPRAHPLFDVANALLEWLDETLVSHEYTGRRLIRTRDEETEDQRSWQEQMMEEKYGDFDWEDHSDPGGKLPYPQRYV